jgi:hypothetical protein
LALLFSVFAWHFFLFVYGNLQRIIDHSEWRGGLDIFWVLFEPIFWLTVMVTTVICLLRDFLYKAIVRNFFWGLYYQILKSKNKFDIKYEKPKENNIKLKRKILPIKKQKKTEIEVELKEMDVEEKIKLQV